MKKIFAICAVALVAASMLVSCNKDEKNAMTVTLGDTKWVANDVYADVSEINSTELAAIYIDGSEDYQSDSVAFVHGIFGPAEGTYTKDGGYMVAYYENATDINSDGYANWAITSATQEITGLDLNAKTIAAEANQTMRNDRTGASDVAMTVKMTDVAWVEVTGLAKNAKIAK